MTETFSVSAIKNGTVIDHITAGQSLRIVRLLSLHASKHTMTIGMYLPSKRMGKKDLVKIENKVLTPAQANEIVVFAPDATINVIKNFNVTEKISTKLPEKMQNIFICPNDNCITQTEDVISHFSVNEENKKIKLTCCYCERTYDRDRLKMNI